jgi:hypothetical protein
MKFPIGWIFFAVLAGCMLDSKDSTCGNSVQCGNPTKIAALEPTAVNGIQGGGIFFPTPYTIRFGESLLVRLDTEFLSQPAVYHGMVYIYQGNQIPVFNSQAADSFPLEGNSVVLHATDLQTLKQATADTLSPIFPFSLRITLEISVKGVVFNQEGLLAGLGVIWQNGIFVTSDSNPLLDAQKIHHLTDPNGYYEGSIQPWDSHLAPGTSAYVYIPGSPYHEVINVTNGHFKFGALPYDLPFEVRFLIVPGSRPGGGKVPAYILTSDPAPDSLRIFRIQPAQDSVVIPE